MAKRTGKEEEEKKSCSFCNRSYQDVSRLIQGTLPLKTIWFYNMSSIKYCLSLAF